MKIRITFTSVIDGNEKTEMIIEDVIGIYFNVRSRQLVIQGVGFEKIFPIKIIKGFHYLRGDNNVTI